MELNHRFEVPVGIDRAWQHLLDMEKVAACFPGATLSSADGADYTGSVKVKLGPIQLTYRGSARIVEADEATHTATIEASGSAPRSGSTAAMTVVASASPAGPDRTEVVMRTDLTVTGRPAQFGRGVMAEVGDKILGAFSDCLARSLAEPDPVPGADGAGDGAGDGTQGEAAADPGMATAAAPGTARGPEAQPLDLLASARGTLIKRLAPVAAALLAVWAWRRLRRGRRRPVSWQ